jgi:hypothetical protein
VGLVRLVDGGREPLLPEALKDTIAKTTVEILNLRPTMSYGLSAVQ